MEIHDFLVMVEGCRDAFELADFLVNEFGGTSITAAHAVDLKGNLVMIRENEDFCLGLIDDPVEGHAYYEFEVTVTPRGFRSKDVQEALAHEILKKIRLRGWRGAVYADFGDIIPSV